MMGGLWHINHSGQSLRTADFSRTPSRDRPEVGGSGGGGGQKAASWTRMAPPPKKVKKAQNLVVFGVFGLNLEVNLKKNPSKTPFWPFWFWSPFKTLDISRQILFGPPRFRRDASCQQTLADGRSAACWLEQKEWLAAPSAPPPRGGIFKGPDIMVFRPQPESSTSRHQRLMSWTVATHGARWSPPCVAPPRRHGRWRCRTGSRRSASRSATGSCSPCA